MKNCKKLIAGMVLSLLTALNTAGAFSVEASALDETQSNESKAIVQKEPSPTRTIMLFLVGANLESEDGLTTADLIECMNAKYDENVNIIAVTGGTTEWHTASEYLKGADSIDPSLNQVWKVEGKKTGRKHGKMTLLEPDGLPGFEDSLLSQPAALKGFVDYCYDNYKTEYYDIILWNHGGGPAGGFGSDYRFTEEDNHLSMAEMMEGFADSKFIKDGKKFEILDFDACLMSNVEVAASLCDFADNLVMSSANENDTGQYYTPFLNAVRKNPSMSGFDLGKCIADSLISFEEEIYSGYASSTLAVINTENFKNRLADKIGKFDDILISEAKNPGKLNGNLNFYDEFQALDYIIKFGEGLFDLGGFAGAFSTPRVEGSNVTDEEYMSRENSYTAAAKEILSILNDQDGSGDDVLYSACSSDYVRRFNDRGIRGLDGELLRSDEDGLVSVSPTGLSIYLCGPKDTEGLGEEGLYLYEMDAAVKNTEDPVVKALMTKRINAVGYYKLISVIGSAVSKLKSSGVEKIDLEAVKTYLSTQNEGWDSKVEKLIDYLESTGEFGSREEGYKYISTLIAQQQKDYAAPDDISAKKIMSDEDFSNWYRVDFKNCLARALTAMNSGISMRLDNDYKSDLQKMVDDFYGEHKDLEEVFPSEIWVNLYASEGGFDASDKIGDFYEDDILIRKNFFSKDNYSCLLRDMEPIFLAMKDSTGKQHIIYEDYYDDSFSEGYVPIIIRTNGEYKLASLEFFTDENGDGYVFYALFVYDNDEGRYIIKEFSSEEWEDAYFAPIINMTDSNGNNFNIPISSFIKIDNTKELWGLSLDYANYKEISDNCFKPDYHYEDIYGVTHSLNDAVDKAKKEAELGNAVHMIYNASVTVEDVYYDGTEQKPEVVVTLGENVLEEGVDYNLFYDGSIYIGPAQLKIVGIGNYIGVKTVDYTILCPHSFELTRTKAATCTKKGKTEYKCSICGEKKIEEIEPLGHEYGEWIVTRKPTTTREGKKIRICIHCGKIETEAIPTLQVDISKAEYRISNKKLYYTGSTVTPELKVAYKGKLLTEGTHYELSFENAVEPGKATFKINGIGQFTGTLTGEYIINPAKVKINSAASDAAGTVDVSWENDGTVDGYEILLYSSKTHGFVRSISTFNAAGNESSIKITDLQAGRRYNVFVRSYKMIDGEPVYSKYGSSQSVMVKEG